MLKEQGVERVKVDPLAKILNVTRGSFYWHFKKRQDLLDAILSYWKILATDKIVKTTENTATSAESRLRRLLETAFQGDADHFRLEGAIRAWARTDDKVDSLLDEIENKRVNYLLLLIEQLGWPIREAAEHARHIYYCRTGLYHQAVLPDKEARFATVDYLLNLVRRG